MLPFAVRGRVLPRFGCAGRHASPCRGAPLAQARGPTRQKGLRAPGPLPRGCCAKENQPPPPRYPRVTRNTCHHRHAPRPFPSFPRGETAFDGREKRGSFLRCFAPFRGKGLARFGGGGAWFRVSSCPGALFFQSCAALLFSVPVRTSPTRLLFFSVSAPAFSCWFWQNRLRLWASAFSPTDPPTERQKGCTRRGGGGGARVHFPLACLMVISDADQIGAFCLGGALGFFTPDPAFAFDQARTTPVPRLVSGALRPFAVKESGFWGRKNGHAAALRAPATPSLWGGGWCPCGGRALGPAVATGFLTLSSR